jgi:hypothetical protein
MIAHARRQVELAPVTKLRDELALKNEENVAAFAPMVGEVAGRIFDMTNPDIAHVDSSPERRTPLSIMGCRLDIGPGDRSEH